MNKINNSAPIAKEISDFHFPEISVKKLNNNISIYFLPNNSVQLSGIKIIASTGASNESIPGLAYTTTNLILKGSPKRSASQIAKYTDFYGIKMNATTYWDFTNMQISCLDYHFDKALNIFFDCLFNPLFKETELERQKKKYIADIIQDTNDPGYLAQHGFYCYYYQNHQYGHSLQGTVDSITTINRQDCVDWYEQHFLKSKFNIIVFGRNDFDNTTSLINKYLKHYSRINSLNNNDFNNNIVNPIPNNTGNHLVLTNFKDINQINICIGKKSILYSDISYPYTQIVNTVFGGYFLSRLNDILRETHGYTYGIYSFIDIRQLDSTLLIRSSIKQNSLKNSINIIFDELNRISNQEITTEEHFRAVQFILGSFLRSVETPQQVARILQTIITNKLQMNFYDELFLKIKESNPQDLLECQNKLFKPDNLVVSLVGSIKYIRENLKDFGQEHVFDKQKFIIK